jgi:hypothetical protein
MLGQDRVEVAPSFSRDDRADLRLMAQLGERLRGLLGRGAGPLDWSARPSGACVCFGVDLLSLRD